MKNSTINWQDYRANLYNFILKRVKDSSAAEDIVQDVLIKAYANQNSLRKQEKLREWFFQIARNAVIDHYRSHKQTEQLPFDLSEGDLSTATSVEQELAVCMKPFIKRLPDHYQKAVTLSELEGLSQLEVASVLGLTHSGAKSRVQRGRKLLEEMLLECCRIETDSRGNLLDYQSGETCGDC